MGITVHMLTSTLMLSAVRTQTAQSAPMLQVLARGEDGAQYPTPCFVQPLQLGRALSTPRSAARFVALLQRRDGLGTGAGAYFYA